MKTVALVQARMSSSRFPGKVLEELGGKPMLQFMFERIKRAKLVDDVVLLTSTDDSDAKLADLAKEQGYYCFRGSLDDVLARFVGAAKEYPAERYIRLTGDCPLIDPGLIDAVISLHQESGADYASNIDPPSFADGMDIEIFSAAALNQANNGASTNAHREHVTLWMRENGNGLVRSNLAAIAKSDDIRLTVDYPDDLTVIRKIVETIGQGCDYFDMLRFLQNQPELMGFNVHKRNEALKL